MKKLTAIVNLPFVDLGVRRCTFEDGSMFDHEMARFQGKRVNIRPYDAIGYDFYGSLDSCNGMALKREWLKDFEEEVDWASVPKDTKVLVRDRDSQPWVKRYFSYKGKCHYFCFPEGSDSWSSASIPYGIEPWNQAKFWREGGHD